MEEERKLLERIKELELELAQKIDEVELWQTRAIHYMNEAAQEFLAKKALERK